MVPDSAVAVVVIVLALLPGSMYLWAFERQAGDFGVNLADRVLRFVAVSLIFHLLLAWPEYAIVRMAGLTSIDGTLSAPQFAAAWLGVLMLVAVPGLLGGLVGGLYASRNSRNGYGWLRARHWFAKHETQVLAGLVGRTPAPRAWDDLFSDRPNVYLRVRTSDGAWLAGRFAADSYAAGYPNPTDLLLEEAWEIDSSSGELGEGGLGYPVYIPADQIGWIDVIDASSEVGI